MTAGPAPRRCSRCNNPLVLCWPARDRGVHRLLALAGRFRPGADPLARRSRASCRSSRRSPCSRSASAPSRTAGDSGVRRPGRRRSPARRDVAAWRSTRRHPDVYLILLDGYPRSDKLRSVFGVDDSEFLDDASRVGLRRRDTQPVELPPHAAHAREHVQRPSARPVPVYGAPGRDASRDQRCDGVEAVRERGYETVSIPSDFEIVAMRTSTASWTRGSSTSSSGCSSRRTPAARRPRRARLFERQHRARVAETFGRAEDLVAEDGPARLASSTSPARTRPSMDWPRPEPMRQRPTTCSTTSSSSTTWAVPDTRRLGEVGYVTSTSRCWSMRSIDGSSQRRRGVLGPWLGREVRCRYAVGVGIDLRSANLLAVRGLGDIDNRSTLVNLLPTIAERLFGVPFTPADERVRSSRRHHHPFPSPGLMTLEPAVGTSQPAEPAHPSRRASGSSGSPGAGRCSSRSLLSTRSSGSQRRGIPIAH